MNSRILGLLAVALLAGPLVADAQGVTYDFTGVITSSSQGGLIGEVVSGDYVFTYTSADTIVGTIGSNSGWAVSSQSVPNNLVFSSTVVGAGLRYQSVPIPTADLGGESSVSGNGATFTAYEYATAFPSSSYLDIQGIAPYDAEGLPVFSNSNDETAIGGFSIGGDTPIGVISAGGVPDGGVAVEYHVTSLTQAPEIDPASAAAGLTLLLGGLVALRGRRPSNRVVA